MSTLSATQSDGYYLSPEYFESGAYKTVSRNRFAAETEASGRGITKQHKPLKVKVGYNQWLKHGVVRFELPEKAVCFGCKQSVGRGTRFNARKTKTGQSSYCTTTAPIFEFKLSCRNCQEPWVIRTNPKERGFEYVSGVKRQAGQERNLFEAFLLDDGAVTATIAATATATATATTTAGDRTSLDGLEAAAVATKGELEIGELEALRKLNEKASAAGKDVDHNASIRKAFRTDRREKRKRLVGGTTLGWNKGMALLPSSDTDVLASKEACFGRASRDERRTLSGLRKSSIFGVSSRSRRPEPHRGKGRGNRNNTGNDVNVKAEAGSEMKVVVKRELSSGTNAPDPVPSGRAISTEEDLPVSPTPTPEIVSSSSIAVSVLAVSTRILKTKTTLRLSNNAFVSVVAVGRGEESKSNSNSNSNSNPKAAASQSGSNGGASRNETGSISKSEDAPEESNRDSFVPPSSFLELLGGYGTSDDDER